MKSYLILRTSILISLLQFTTSQYSTADEDTTCEASLLEGLRVEDELKIICHIGLWFTAAHFGSYTGDMLDPFLCTHYVVNYYEIDRDQNKWTLKTPLSAAENAVMTKVFQLKKKNPSLQMLIAIGGYTDNLSDTTKYFDLMSLEENTLKFSYDTVRYLKTNPSLDGVDFQWNYPGRHPESDADMDRELLANFTKTFCSTLRINGYVCMVTLQRPHHQVQNKNQTLEAFAAIIREADIITIWTADIPPEPTAFVEILHTDLLYKPPAGTFMYDRIAENTVQALMEVFTEEVLGPNDAASRNKLLLTIPMQANSFNMKRYNKTWTDSWPEKVLEEKDIPNAPQFGELTNTGYSTGLEQVPFFKVCRQARLLQNDDHSKYFLHSHYRQNGTYSAPIAYNRERLVPTNTIESIKDKVKYAKQLKLGGVSVFQIGADDVNGWCYNQTYPLLNAIYDEIHKPE